MDKQFQGDSFRPWNALGPWLRRRFGGPVARLPVDAGFTCPTRDGTLATGGCLYCDAGGARAAHAEPAVPVARQIALGIERNRAGSRPAEHFIAYFQAFTNTYAAPATLERLYSEALDDPRVAALAIGTRPDCLPDDALDVIERIARRTFLWLEVGVQSASDEALRRVGRGHDAAAFADAARRLRERGIRFSAHVIFGLPGDDPSRAPEAAAQLLNAAGVWAVKAHNLYIDAGSALAEAWRRGEVEPPSRETYMEMTIAFLRHLDERILVDRLVGQAPAARLLAPSWCAGKSAFLQDLEREMRRRGVRQGDTMATQEA